jgi:hypothetical protein
LLFAILSTLLVMQTPEPAASPPKEIIRVTSRPLCSAIRDRIGPSVAALLENDAFAGDGMHYIFEMGRDEGRPWMQIDKLHLENDISKIIRNLEVIDGLLRSEAADEAADGSDHTAIERLKAKLRQVAHAQRAGLNVLDGTLESESMGELMSSDLPSSLTSSLFPLTKLSGDEISSDVAGDQNALPSDAPSGFPDAIGPISNRNLKAPSGLTPAAAVSDLPDSPNGHSRLGKPGGIDSAGAAEAAFTQELLPQAAQCRRLVSPPPR